MNVRAKIEPLLLQAQKPAQYIGGEVGSICKERESVDVRFAFCFPDTYEIGMSHLGMKILYSLINARENFWCERVFAPCADFEALMREHQIPLYSRKVWIRCGNLTSWALRCNMSCHIPIF